MIRLINTLSGRVLTLTVIFLMLAEVLIFVPSVARFRVEYLQERLELSQLASLSLLATPNEMVSMDLERELLENAEVLNVVLRRDEMRELILSGDMPAPVAQTYDLRDPAAPVLIRDALLTMMGDGNRIIRVIGMPVKGGGMEIEVTLHEEPLRTAMLQYGLNILWLSLVISAITATLLFLAVRRFIVKPMKRVVRSMVLYAEDPEDSHRIIRPTSRVRELMAAEVALSDLQTQLTRSLRQKERLAALGGAVSRISHDLRNMLTTAQLLADRFETSADPTVKRSAPKLIGSLDRAIGLCERTLTFGKAEEPAPQLQMHALRQIVEEVLEGDRVQTGADAGEVELICDVPGHMRVEADAEQFFRVLANLVSNARQAIVGTGKPGRIRVSATETDRGLEIVVEDTGPGLPARAQENLFQPFKGSARRGGTGLGLAIAAELVRGHGGALELRSTSAQGTVFCIRLPRPLAKAG
ncbi:sensor histidine kinase [Rhodobacteraceae bacterium 2CG4]|uniref:histidine kinase n=1 Tax=Halovulum marinum TaxID=2662447 RepID=A0A6L5Z5A9_9RHOB|nr:HAMP domain-containing sensor histidine kinase [Halovulum marinum]MSU91597.1 sensor histidine kinase [Halovulum marinum]